MKKLLLATTLASAAFCLDATDYYLVGGFNGWSANTDKMTDQGDGTYAIDIEKLTPTFKVTENGDWHPMWGAATETDNKITPGEPFPLVRYETGDPYNLVFADGIDQLENARVVFNPAAATITVTGKQGLPDYYVTGSFTSWAAPGSAGTYLLTDDGTGILRGEITIANQSSADPTRFQICKYGTWDGAVGLDKAKYADDYKVSSPATGVSLAVGGGDIRLDVGDGIYALAFDLAKMTLDMTKTGDVKPEIPTYYLTGSMTSWAMPGAAGSIKLEDYGNGKAGCLLGIYTQTETNPTRFQIGKFNTWEGAIGLDKQEYAEDFKVTAPASGVKLAEGGRDILLDVENGAYSVIFDQNAMTLSMEKYDTGISPEELAVFTGNSICDFWDSTDPTLFAAKAIINTGVSGETSRQILARFDDDVLAHNPGVVVIISPSTNDIAQNEGPVTQEQMVENVRQMILKAQSARAAKRQVILTSNLPCNYFFWNPSATPADEIMEVNEKLRALATETGATYVDLHQPMANEQNGLDNEYTEDGCHPNAAGYKVMEEAIMPAVAQARSTISSIDNVKSDRPASTATSRYYNLHGAEVANPSCGIYIRVHDGKADKIIIR